MDPGLWEILEGDAGEEIEAIVRLQAPDRIPPGLRLVAQFGEIATCRLPRNAILSTRADEAVASLKAPRLVVPDLEIEDLGSEAVSPESRAAANHRRPPSLTVTGRGVVVGIADWGCDFAHPDFCHADGATRLEALWDQRSPERYATNRYGYGTVYTADDINRALRMKDPYAALGYHPAGGDPGGTGSHGTHVMGIAAGNGRAGGPVGVAPEAHLVFVHLAAGCLEGEANLGDSKRILEAVAFILGIADGRPCVINLSVGRTGGDKTGTSLVEQGLDAAVGAAPGRAIAQSAGNYYNQRMHTFAQLRPGEKRTFVWHTDQADVTPNELEFWYPGRDVLSVELDSPDGTHSWRAAQGERVPLTMGEHKVGMIYHRTFDPNNGDHHIDLFLYPEAPAGDWEVTVTGEDVVDGRTHGYVERDAACPNCQSRFDPFDAVSSSTTGTICNGFRTIAVGAYDPHSPDGELAPFSSGGPTRDGRQKPDLVAPGVSILAPRSAPHDSRDEVPMYTEKSGTSMAAPRVTGTLALMFEAAGKLLPIADTRRLLLSSTRSVDASSEIASRIGSGYLDIERAVEAARGFTEEKSLDADKVATIAANQTETQSFVGPITAQEKDKTGVRMSSEQEGSQIEGSGDELLEEEKEDESMQSLDYFESDEDEMVDDEVYPDVERSGPTLVELAGEVISSGEVSYPSGDLLRQVWFKAGIEDTLSPLGAGSFPSPAAIFDAFTSDRSPAMRHHFEQFFEVVAEPGLRLNDPLKAGDVLVRRALGEGNLAHLSILVTGEALRARNIAEAGLIPEDGRDGLYVQVVEAGAFPHIINDRFARRLATESGQLDADQMILRIKSLGTVLPGFGSQSMGDSETVGLPMEVVEGPQAELTWIDLNLIRGPDGNRHLYYLLTGPGRGRPSQFKLRVRNTNSGINFLVPYFLVRLRSKRADDSIDVVPLEGARDDGWKRIPWSKLPNETSRTITFEIIPSTLQRAFDPDNALTWLDVRFRWREIFESSRRLWGRNTSLAFFMVAPATLMFRQSRVVQRSVALNDPHLHQRFWAFVTEKTFSPSDRTPLEVSMTVEASISSATARGITLTGTYSTTRGTSQTIDVRQSYSASMEAGIDDIIKIGASQATEIGTSFTWTTSRTRTYSQAATQSRTFTEGLTGRKTVSGQVPPPPEGNTRQTMYLYPVVDIHLLPVYEYYRPSSLGQATRFRIVRNVPIAVPIGWGIINIPRP